MGRRRRPRHKPPWMVPKRPTCMVWNMAKKAREFSCRPPSMRFVEIVSAHSFIKRRRRRVIFTFVLLLFLNLVAFVMMVATGILCVALLRIIAAFGVRRLFLVPTHNFCLFSCSCYQVDKGIRIHFSSHHYKILLRIHLNRTNSYSTCW